MGVTAKARTVYLSPRAGRHYLTLRAAVNAEARKIIEAKYPSERPEYENGQIAYPGSHWSDIPRSEVMHRRLARLVRADYDKNTKG